MALRSPLDRFIFESLVQKLNLLGAAMNDSIIRVVNAPSAEFNDIFDKFIRNIPTIINNNTIGDELNDLFIGYEKVGKDFTEKYLLGVNLFDFGDDEVAINLNEEQINNNQTINTATQVNALSIAYNASVNVEYGNEYELGVVINTLDDQFKKLLEIGLDDDTRNSLIDLRKLSNQYYADLEIAEVVDISTETIPSLVLSHRLYGTSTKSDSIVQLNNVLETGFIEGDIRVISTESENEQ